MGMAFDLSNGQNELVLSIERRKTFEQGEKPPRLFIFLALLDLSPAARYLSIGIVQVDTLEKVQVCSLDAVRSIHSYSKALPDSGQSVAPPFSLKRRATDSPPCGVMDRDSTGDTPSVYARGKPGGYPIIYFTRKSPTRREFHQVVND